MLTKRVKRLKEKPYTGARTTKRMEGSWNMPTTSQNTAAMPDGFGFIVETIRAAMKPAVVFDARGPVNTFLEKLEAHFLLYPVPEHQKVILATGALRGQAATWYKCIGKCLLGEPGTPTYTYENFKLAILRAFPVVKDRAKLEAELFSKYQQRVDELSEFILRKIQVFKLLYGTRPDPEIIQIILPRLLPSIQDFMELRNPVTLDKLFELAVQFESRRAAENQRRQSQKPATEENTRKAFKLLRNIAGKGVQCSEEKKNPSEVQLNTVMVRNIELPRLQLLINNVPATALLDTGAQGSCLAEEFFKKHFRRYRLHSVEGMKVVAAQGKTCQCMGKIELYIKIGEEQKKIMFLVVKNLQASVILGTDFFAAVDAKIDFENSTLQVTMDPVKKKSTPPPEVDLSHLTPEEQDKFRELVSNFADLFDDIPGFTQIVAHEIKLTTDEPIRQRPYKYDKVKEEIIKYHIDEMLRNKIITPISSAYASPVVLCKKNNDLPLTDPLRYRFAIDYRKLNSITKFPTYPLPVIDEILRSIKSTKYITTLDLTSGYFQISIKPEDVHKTAFITKYGTYGFLRMPFGLSGAPATFQRCMDKILRPVIGKSTFIYLDDIIVTSESLEEHIKDLREVFTLLKDAGLKVNIKKCKFAAKELKYLGYKISQRGIETDKSKVIAVKNYPIPNTAKKLATFLGMCSYYRIFIKNFAEIAEPLLKLRRKRVRFAWSSEANAAFEKLKESLINAPVLKFPEKDKGLEIYADASDYAIGAVLTQNRKAIAFFSRTLNDTQRNYSATERETLAVLAAVQKFCVYFGSSPVTVYSDHAAVTRLFSGKNLSPRLIRWTLKLQEFNLIIKHTPGKDNVVADALSRIKLDENGEKVKIAMLQAKVIDSRETVIEEIARDPEFGNIYNYLKDPDNFQHIDINAIRSRAQNYEIIDGLLFYTKVTNQNSEYRPVIPAKLILSILQELHDSPVSGHFGIRKTIQRVREAVYFPQLQKIVKNYCQTCHTCQINNDVNFRPAGLLTSIESRFPNEIIGIDLLGPYPRSHVNKARFLLVIVDHFSKWVELIPLKRASAKVVADSFLNKYILRYGCPARVISDNGPQFVSSTFKMMCDKLGIKHMKMVPYRPQSNIAERVNKNIVKLIRNYVQKHHSNWDDCVEEFAFALRTAKHETTKKSPAELFLGRKIMTPLDKLFYVKDRAPEFQIGEIEKMLKEAEKCSREAQKKQKYYYDSKRRTVEYKVGEEVLKQAHALSCAAKDSVAKFCPRWHGPFEITRIVECRAYLKNEKGEETVANFDQIKHYYRRANNNILKEFLQGPASQNFSKIQEPQPGPSTTREPSLKRRLPEERKPQPKKRPPQKQKRKNAKQQSQRPKRLRKERPNENTMKAPPLRREQNGEKRAAEGANPQRRSLRVQEKERASLEREQRLQHKRKAPPTIRPNKIGRNQIESSQIPDGSF
ncbi:Retrovirus-related Pol polyprotein from transposon 297, partial [Stegodyphus mimosarum]